MKTLVELLTVPVLALPCGATHTSSAGSALLTRVCVAGQGTVTYAADDGGIGDKYEGEWLNGEPYH